MNAHRCNLCEGDPNLTSWPLAHEEDVCTAIAWYHWMRRSSHSWRMWRVIPPRAEATLGVIDTRTGEVWVVPVPGVWVKAGLREVFTPKTALAP